MHKNKLTVILILSVFILSLALSSATLAKAPKLSLATPKAVYRKVDTTGKIVGENTWTWKAPGVGIGNIIFSTSPLPYQKESTYLVRNAYPLADVTKFLSARAYYPAKLADIVAMIEYKKPSYSFSKMKYELIWVPAEGRSESATTQNTSLGKKAGWDQQRFPIIPKSQYSFRRSMDWAKVAKEMGPGSTVTMNVILEFFNGKSRDITKWDDYRQAYITEQEFFRDSYLIAKGKFKVK